MSSKKKLKRKVNSLQADLEMMLANYKSLAKLSENAIKIHKERADFCEAENILLRTEIETLKKRLKNE